MRPEFCMCCNATTQFRNAVFTASNIVQHLQRITGNLSCEKDREYYNILHLLSYDKRRISFPCGMCYKVNQRELDNMEEKMDELLCVFLLKHPEKVKYIHEILRLLAGYYPIKYRTVERKYKEKEK